MREVVALVWWGAHDGCRGCCCCCCFVGWSGRKEVFRRIPLAWVCASQVLWVAARRNWCTIREGAGPPPWLHWRHQPPLDDVNVTHCVGGRAGMYIGIYVYGERVMAEMCRLLLHFVCPFKRRRGAKCAFLPCHILDVEFLSVAPGFSRFAKLVWNSVWDCAR